MPTIRSLQTRDTFKYRVGPFDLSGEMQGGSGSRLRAASIAVAAIVVLISFTGLSESVGASADPPNSQSTSDPVYGPGYTITNLTDGRVRVEYLPTFQRWDGVWRPMSGLNRSTGEWPYLAEDTPTHIQVTRSGHSFVQFKIPLVVYEFLRSGPSQFEFAMDMQGG